MHSPCRQLDCLRQLVVVLCERAQLQDLVEFPYVNLHDEVSPPARHWLHPRAGRPGTLGTRWLPLPQVVGIIESRARAVDLMTHSYYELLYAFHIYRHNYRKGEHCGESLLASRRDAAQGPCVHLTWV